MVRYKLLQLENDFPELTENLFIISRVNQLQSDSLTILDIIAHQSVKWI